MNVKNIKKLMIFCLQFISLILLVVTISVRLKPFIALNEVSRLESSKGGEYIVLKTNEPLRNQDNIYNEELITLSFNESHGDLKYIGCIRGKSLYSRQNNHSFLWSCYKQQMYFNLRNNLFIRLFFRHGDNKLNKKIISISHRDERFVQELEVIKNLAKEHGAKVVKIDVKMVILKTHTVFLIQAMLYA